MAVTRPRESRTLSIPQCAGIPLNHSLITLLIMAYAWEINLKLKIAKEKMLSDFVSEPVISC